MTKKADPVNLIFLRAVGFQRLKAIPVEVQFNPDGITFIEGKNASGKSSTLDSLAFAIAGKTALSKQPIHEGMDEASVEIKLSNGRRIVRHIKRKGEKQYTTALELFGPEGEKYSAAEATVRDWLGDPGIAFDPMEFSRMDPKRRRILLAQIVGIDLDQFDAAEKAAEQQRLGHFGVYETAKRKHDEAMLKPLPPRQPERVDVAALNAELSAAMDAHAAYQDATNTLSHAKATLLQAESELQNRQRRLDEIKAEMARAAESVKQAQGVVNLAKTQVQSADAIVVEKSAVPDISAIRQKLESATDANQSAMEYDLTIKQRAEITATWVAESTRRDELTAAVEAVRKSRLDALAEATFPVAGLGFEADDCTFNNIPFSQASQAEKIRVGLAIAMAQNPTLRLITSYDGSLLDDDNLKVIHEMTRGQGYQFVVERVANEPTGNGIFIEDGEVKA